MFYKIENKNKELFAGTGQQSMEFLQRQNVMLAVNVRETGLNLSFMQLNVNESITLDSENEEEIKVTRVR